MFALGNHSCLCPRIWFHPLPSDLVPVFVLRCPFCLVIHSSLPCIFLCSPLVYPLLLFLFSSQYQCYLFPLINSTLPPIPFCSSVNNKNIALTPPSSPTPVPPPSFRHRSKEFSIHFPLLFFTGPVFLETTSKCYFFFKNFQVRFASHHTCFNKNRGRGASC